MKAMVLPRITSLVRNDRPLELVELPVPEPRPGELLVRVSACGVCHTELDEIEGRTAPPSLPVVPGHEVVGTVAGLGADATRFQLGDRVGVGWIHQSTGEADENLSGQFIATGRDVNGGYAEFMTVPEDYAHPIPDAFQDAQAAPLLCAGAIGYRAVKLARLKDGERLGLSGFGASAHLVLQLVKFLYAHTEVYVFARDIAQQEFARQLGAEWAGDTCDDPPEKLHAIIDTTPVWRPIVESLRNLRPSGRLIINAIRKESSDQTCLQTLRYQEHLWMEKEIKSVANITRLDIAEFLPIAAAIPIQPSVKVYPLEQANEAIMELRQGGLQGARVLRISTNGSPSAAH